MNKILNRKIDEETIILEEKILKSSEYTDVRCILIQEKRELHVSVLYHEISKLKKRLMTAHDNESGALMDQIIHLKKLINGMKGDYDIFEVRATGMWQQTFVIIWGFAVIGIFWRRLHSLEA